MPTYLYYLGFLPHLSIFISLPSPNLSTLVTPTKTLVNEFLNVPHVSLRYLENDLIRFSILIQCLRIAALRNGSTVAESLLAGVGVKAVRCAQDPLVVDQGSPAEFLLLPQQYLPGTNVHS